MVGLLCGWLIILALTLSPASAEEGSLELREVEEQNPRVDPDAAALTPTLAPDQLSETGLYSDFASKTVAPENRAFSPQYPLWTDGAEKSRWIFLPPGTQVITSNWDRWEFPSGTKIWKEFRIGGRRVETRLIEKLGDQPHENSWRMVTYRWNAGETEARLLSSGEATDVDTGLRQGDQVVMYNIPSSVDCLRCHSRGGDPVLGFDALQLSTNRDPNAPRAEPLPRGAVTLSTLSRDGLLSRGWTGKQPVIPGRSADERASLGYLHGNCAHCHNDQGRQDFLDLRHRIGLPRAQQPAIQNIGVETSKFGTDDGFKIIAPGDPAKSCIPARMGQRGDDQMPPLGTGAVHDEAVQLIRRWIQSLPATDPREDTDRCEHPDRFEGTDSREGSPATAPPPLRASRPERD